MKFEKSYLGRRHLGNLSSPRSFSSSTESANKIRAHHPPALFYGFAGVALAWQFVFLIIASNPVRFRPLMLVGILEKLGFFLPTVALYAQHRLRSSEFFIPAPTLSSPSSSLPPT